MQPRDGALSATLCLNCSRSSSKLGERLKMPEVVLSLLVLAGCLLRLAEGASLGEPLGRSIVSGVLIDKRETCQVSRELCTISTA